MSKSSNNVRNIPPFNLENLVSKRNNSSNILCFNLDDNYMDEISWKMEYIMEQVELYANGVPIHRTDYLDNLSQHFQYTLSCSYFDDYKE